MGSIKFEESQDLPIGVYEPCRLESVTYREPTEETLAKWPDMKPSWCFRFVLEDENSEFNGYSSVRFCNHVASKLGGLYLFLCDLAGGTPLEEADPESFAGRHFRIRVRQKQKSDKVHVQGADPIESPSSKASKPPESEASPAGPPDSKVPF